MVRIGVASRETRKVFWSRLSRSSTIGESTVVFTKMLTIKPLEEAAVNIDKNSLPKGSSPFSIHFDIAGFPPFTLELDVNGVEVTETSGADVEVRGMIDSPSHWALALSIVMGRLKLKGYRHALGLFRYRRALSKFISAVQSEKSTANQLA